MEFDPLSNAVIGYLIEVHRSLGPGLLESSYERCLCFELAEAGIPFQAQHEIPVVYKGQQIDCGYRADVVVDETLILELKSVDRLLPVHEAQLLSYMKLGGFSTGLLVNFNVKLMRDGIKRFVL